MTLTHTDVEASVTIDGHNGSRCLTTGDTARTLDSAEISTLLFYLFSSLKKTNKKYFSVPCEKFGSSYLGKAIAVARAVLPIRTCVCSVFLCPVNGMATSVWDF